MSKIRTEPKARILEAFSKFAETRRRGTRSEIGDDKHTVGLFQKGRVLAQDGGAMANHILGDGGLGNGDAQLCQLAMHAGSSQERVGPAHVPYQLTYFRERRLVVRAYAVGSSKSNIV